MSTKTSVRNLVVWVTLGVIVVAFGLSFGLPDDSLTFGKQGLARVYGESISREEYTYQTRMAAHVIGIAPREEVRQQQIRWRENMLDAVVERRVLAELAEDLGLAATTREAEELTSKGQWIAFGESRNYSGDEPFSYKWFTRSLLPTIQASERAYLEYQRQELLARALRDVIAATSMVSESEERLAFASQVDHAALAYAVFDPAKFGQIADPSAAEIDAYVGAHSAELESAYAAASNQYKAQPNSVDLWILSRSKVPAAADAPAGTIDAGKAQAEVALGRVRAGEPFAKVARELSEHNATALSGGHYGWVDLVAAKGALDAMGLDAAVVEAASALAGPGISPVVAGKDAYFVVAVTATRSGDVDKAVALRELAEQALRKTNGAILASQAAKSTNDKVFAEQKPLEEVLRTTNLAPNNMVLGPGCDLGTHVQTSGRVRRDGEIPGLGKFPEQVKALLALPKDKIAIADVLEQEGKHIVATLGERSFPSDEEFVKSRDYLTPALQAEKAAYFTHVIAHNACIGARGRGQIKPNDALIKRLMTYDNASTMGDGATANYVMCDDVGAAGAQMLAQVRMQQQMQMQLQQLQALQKPGK